MSKKKHLKRFSNAKRHYKKINTVQSKRATLPSTNKVNIADVALFMILRN